MRITMMKQQNSYQNKWNFFNQKSTAAFALSGIVVTSCE